jgi:hypothetical protein
MRSIAVFAVWFGLGVQVSASELSVAVDVVLVHSIV